jgi:hypothetical protein
MEEYVHVEIETAQSSKRADWPCGDLVGCQRNEAATSLVCADGIGSGIRAHIAAELCVSRLLELLRLGTSLRKAVNSVVRSMERNREPGSVFAAFTVARILNDGMTTVLGYEAPPPALLTRRHAVLLPSRSVELGGTLVTESECYLEPGEGLLLMSDGITQAGIGRGMSLGWQTEGVLRFADSCLSDGHSPRELAALVHNHVRQRWGEGGDDCTAVTAWCRRGQILNILTGPPSVRANDGATVRRFMQAEGLNVVSGGTTAEVVARVLGKPIRMARDPSNSVAPPHYEIPGIDLVTEGAVTLNQVYNVLGENLDDFTEISGVTELCALMHVADRINFTVGQAKNQSSGDMSFRQCGILTRDHIVPLIAEKLRTAGKLVVVEWV